MSSDIGIERPETMAVGAQDIGEHVGVTRIGLAASRAVAGPAGADHVGVDRDDRVPGPDQRIDNQAGRAFDGNGQFAGGRNLAQPGKHVSKTCGIVPGLDAGEHLAGAIDDANGMGSPAPVQTSVKWHVLTSLGCDSLTRAGRSCGSLTDWRSGGQALAHHPVVRRGLPAPAVRRVSCGPSSGKRRWPSRQELGLPNAIPITGKAPSNTKVHQ